MRHTKITILPEFYIILWVLILCTIILSRATPTKPTCTKKYPHKHDHSKSKQAPSTQTTALKNNLSQTQNATQVEGTSTPQSGTPTVQTETLPQGISTTVPADVPHQEATSNVQAETPLLGTPLPGTPLPGVPSTVPPALVYERRPKKQGKFTSSFNATSKECKDGLNCVDTNCVPT